MKSRSLKDIQERSKALTQSRIVSVLMLVVIVALILVVTWQRGTIAGYEAEAARHHAEKEKKAIGQPTFRML